jgi:hypothetical protein
LDEGRDGEWNRGRPPRAWLAPAVLCAPRAAATRRRRVGGGGLRINAEKDEKVAAGGIAAGVPGCVRRGRGLRRWWLVCKVEAPEEVAHRHRRVKRER